MAQLCICILHDSTGISWASKKYGENNQELSALQKYVVFSSRGDFYPASIAPDCLRMEEIKYMHKVNIDILQITFDSPMGKESSK